MSNRRIAATSLALGTLAFLAVGLALLASGLVGTSDRSVRAAAGKDANEPAREIRLVARNMAFYLEGGDVPNPTLSVRAGERVRITFRNDEPGMLHDLATEELGLATPVLDHGSTASLELTAPRQPQSHDYVCTLHPVLMRGRIEVR